MPKRRTHSSIDKLPANLRDVLVHMIVDNEWPEDFKGEHDGHPRYEDLVSYCERQGHAVSKSAIGRFGKQMRTIARMKMAGIISREAMKDLTDENAGQTQKAVAEMITAVVIEKVADMNNPTAREIRDLATTVRDCTAIALNADKNRRGQLEQKAKEAAANTREKLTDAGVDRKLIQSIIDDHLGVTRS